MTSLIVEQLHWQTLELKLKNGKFPMWRLQQKPVKTSIKFSSTSWEKFEREKWTPKAIAKEKRTNHERKSNALSYKEKKKNRFFSVWYVLIKNMMLPTTQSHHQSSSQWIFEIEKKNRQIVPLLFNFLLNFWDQFKTLPSPKPQRKRFPNFNISREIVFFFASTPTTHICISRN